MTIDETKQLHSDFVVALGSPQGKRVYDHMAKFCLKKGCTFVQGSPDKSAFNQGARAVILEIDHWLELDLTTLEGTGETDNEEPIEREQND